MFESVRPTTVLLARHGETVWNVERRFQGHQDSPLSERGREQAGRLHFLDGGSFDQIYTRRLGAR